jgi:LppP/LprE lipoprotein
VSRPRPRALGLAVLLVASTATFAATAAANGPSRLLAQRYAHRTYIVQGSARRVFDLVGHRIAITAGDGSTITAFGAVLADSGDGSGQAVLLFRGVHFLGWASAYDTLHLRVEKDDDAIAVRYGVYRGNDPFCCPSTLKTIRYSWNGRRIVADSAPPLIYGHRGDRLYLGPS